MTGHISFALHLTGSQRGSELSTDAEIAQALREDRPAWLHLAADHADTAAWIDTHLDYLDPAIRAALTEPETRPRALRIAGGLLVILRGINSDPDADPEDMVSVRLWLDPARVVSLSRRRLRSVAAVAEAVRSGRGPAHPGDLLALLVEELTGRIAAQVDSLDARSERLEAEVIADPRADLGATVSDLRLELVELRLFLAPQRDAIRAILDSGIDWLEEGDLVGLGEQLNRMMRVVDELEATRDQLQTIRDELDGAASERLNRNLYVLSVISAVFLPLGFLTGLMGINLAGMPGSDWQPSFWIFCGILTAVTVGVLAALRALRVL